MSEAVSQAVLAELKELLEDGFDLLVERFVSDGQTRIDKIEAALALGDADTIYAEAHGLKGSSRNVGAMPLAESCAQLEAMGQQQNLAGADTVFADIAANFSQTCEALKAF